MPSADDSATSWVGAFGLVRSRSQAASARAPAEASRSLSLMDVSVHEAGADRPRPRNRVAAEVESAVGHGAGRSSRGVLAEEVELRVVAAVVGPDLQVASGQREVDSLAEEAPGPWHVQQVGDGHLAQLHEASIFHVLLEDREPPRVVPGPLAARVA